ncbi:MAG: phenylalanine--tRNA ligase subunit alpha [Gammaproteobacteria bacterium]|nr:phenylalanine--tRNA ligase subunit alpha [Gammaproteobacteria bacterium]
MTEPFAAGIERLRQEALGTLESVGDTAALEAWRVHYLGKGGVVTEELKRIGGLAPAERPAAGQIVNDLKRALSEALDVARATLEAAAQEQASAREAVDVTLPGRGVDMGVAHPLSEAMAHIEAIFVGLGFAVTSGPEIEDEFHNFEALNIPAHHPARAMHDTFYLDHGRLLRTHTSTVQIRYMERHRPPFRIIAPGRVYRSDAPDPTHSPVFHQVEGLAVGPDLTMGHLKSVLKTFLQAFFDRRLALRLRPSYFPFTEPSAEVDISCLLCGGSGCRVCKNTGWIEVLGCGLVHPAVLARVGLDPEVVRGFAFGMGVERLVMLRDGIPDVRLFYENDLRFLKSIGPCA